ncbi:hypothetical protein J2O09_05540 [Elizabethkingia anophelis]|uniref:hypothetical protein n=1 Tax=Elizabethkingia anophelis TaxID=1117645 RepID=UPI0020B7F1E5|nr:hypothetical protein [Elizabethkingia anophelis]UTG62419.1 hypothetical protein J2O09_05540 [Elizabethkingia anophelis]UXM68701.1 hypothetical protein N7E57_05550 [Elizabethkingia anophelis]
MNNINEREKSILINAIIHNQDNPTAESIMKDLLLIDDLLGIQRQRMLFMPKRTKTGKLRKDASFRTVIEKRIEADI